MGYICTYYNSRLMPYDSMGYYSKSTHGNAISGECSYK